MNKLRRHKQKRKAKLRKQIHKLQNSTGENLIERFNMLNMIMPEKYPTLEVFMKKWCDD